MSTYYYADANSQSIGPYPLSELKSLASTGVITASTPVIEHGSSAWSTFSAVSAEHQPSEIAEAVVHQARKIQGQVQASLAEIAWGAAFFGLLLVILHLLILPYSILNKCLKDLSAWGQASRLPSGMSDHSALAFTLVVLRSPAIVILTLVNIGFVIYFLSTGRPTPFDNSGYGTFDFSTRVSPAILRLVITYFEIIPIAFVFDLLALGMSIANNVKKMAEKN